MFEKFKNSKENNFIGVVDPYNNDELFEDDLDATQKELQEAALMGFNSAKEYREYRTRTFGEEIPAMPEYNGEIIREERSR